jgi:branched-subunit amino acid ABC-type transport system permease component
MSEVAQLIVAGVINGSFYGLLGVGFGLILGVTGRFHYAFSLVFAFAAYVASVLESDAGWPYPPAIAGGLLAGVLLGIAIERWVYRPLAQASGAASLLTIFISSLGVTIAGLNVITLIWSASSRSIDILPPQSLHLGDATITSLEASIIVLSWALIVVLGAILRFTGLGRIIKSVRGNPSLARVMGIDADRVYLVVFAIGSLLCGAAGIMNGARFAVQPDMGVKPIAICFVVAFLGGTRSPPITIGLAGMFIGLVESLSGIWVSPQWSSLVVFSVLFLYLVVHPLDLKSLRNVLLVYSPGTRR